MPRVLALTGPIGSGKTTIAAALVAHGFVRRPFAGPLKAMLAALYRVQGLEPDEIEARLSGDKKERPDVLLSGATPRWAMQSLGTEWGRARLSASIWVDAWRRGAQADLAHYDGVVADDVRFEDEARAVRALGGRVIALTRPGVERINDHISELGVAPDAEVANDADPAEVARRVLRA